MAPPRLSYFHESRTSSEAARGPGQPDPPAGLPGAGPGRGWRAAGGAPAEAHEDRGLNPLASPASADPDRAGHPGAPGDHPDLPGELSGDDGPPGLPRRRMLRRRPARA